MAEKTAPPSDARTVQWAPHGPATTGGGKPSQASIGACDACRARKVRCLASENSMSSKCQRCARAGRECVYTVHSKTRRRKRTDTRVKELEEKVRNLSVLLEQGRTGSSQLPNDKVEGPSAEFDEGLEDEYDDESEEEVGNERDPSEDYDGTTVLNKALIGDRFTKADTSRTRSAASQSTQSPEPRSHSSNAMAGFNDLETEEIDGISQDVVDRGVLDMTEATRLFDRYVNELCPQYPAVVFHKGTTASEVRKARPILFLAVIAAGASTADPSLNLRLNKEILQVYATKVALQGQKNLDLVQSLLISSLWIYPPERFDQLKFHQYIHMAATMALDLGLGKRSRNRRYRQENRPAMMHDYEPHTMPGVKTMATPLKPAPDSLTVESRRTLLACYLQCTSVSLSLRLPNALRFTSHMAECLDVLETSAEAAPTDRRFAAWIRFQRIVEDCVNSFSLDDPETTVSLDEIRIQGQLKGYESQMKEWRKNLKPGVMNSFLEINFHVNNCYMHEISIHPDHDPEDFRPPFYIATQLTSKIPTNMNPAYVNAIMECVSSAHAVLNTFFAMPPTLVRALPALIYVRVVYCCALLIKLEVSTNAPKSELANVLDQQTLNVPMYLQKCQAHQVAVVGAEGRNMTAARFLMIMKHLIGWYHNYKAQSATGGEEPQPFDPQSVIDPSSKAKPANPSKQSQSAPAPAPTLASVPSSLPGFRELSADTFQPFSDTANNAPQPPPGQPFTGLVSSSQPNRNMGSSPSSASQLHQQHLQSPPIYDYHAQLIATNASSPGSTVDHSSPEYLPPTINAGLKDMSTISPPPPDFSKMDIDPDMFGQLNHMQQPFTYNPDPNDWLYDTNVGNMGDMMAGMPEFEWGIGNAEEMQ